MLPNRTTRAVLAAGSGLLLLASAFTGCDKQDVPARPEISNPIELEPLEVTGFAPARAMGGDVLSISGIGFNPHPSANRVRVGGVYAAAIAATESTLTVVLPPFALSGQVSVSDVTGWRSGTAEGNFAFGAPDTLNRGANVDPGEPSYTMTTPDYSEVATTTFTITGSVSGNDGSGWWAIVDSDALIRAQGTLTAADLSAGQTVPLFCGSQRILVFFANAAGKSFYALDVLRTTCDEPDIRVRLAWDTDATDVDLHLIKPGGSYGDSTDDTDCYFTNCTEFAHEADWGVEGDHTDDPVLDIDDTNGYGPENIFIDPSEDGRYQVHVHYWSDHGNGPSNAWVEVYIQGVRTAAFGAEPLVDGQIWQVCTIDWPSGAVAAIGRP
jgi:hypothetical protein